MRWTENKTQGKTTEHKVRTRHGVRLIIYKFKPDIQMKSKTPSYSSLVRPVNKNGPYLDRSLSEDQGVSQSQGAWSVSWDKEATCLKRAREARKSQGQGAPGQSRGQARGWGMFSFPR